MAIADARGLLLVENKSKLFEYGGHIKLNRSWAYALFNRMGMIQRKPTTSKSKMNMTDFAQKKAFFDELVAMVKMEEILGMRLICSKIYLLFLPELLKIFPYYSLKYHLLFPNYSALTVRK